ncbi:tyrosine-protein phosphatase [Streptomyces uncialis]
MGAGTRDVGAGSPDMGAGTREPAGAGTPAHITVVPPPPEQSRWIELAGADNVRDLGGLPVDGGGTTRRGVLFRAATLQGVTAEDVALLVDGLKLRTVVDLRGPGEAEREGHGLLTATAVHRANLPVRLPDPDLSGVVPDEPENEMHDFYLGLLRASGDTLTAAARLVADPGRHSLVFHCAVGKDRTGVCAAVLLDAVGVPAEAIATDYALTAERVARVRDRLLTISSYRHIPPLGHAYMASTARSMHDFLARLSADYGGGAGWLVRNGFTDAELTRLRDTLVER